MEGIAQNFKQIVSLFKILLEKSVFIDEHENLLAVRLLEEFDFSNDANTTKSLGLEK